MTALNNNTLNKPNKSAGIPVKNLWLLMLYASEFRYLANKSSGTQLVDEDVSNLVADVLCNLVEKRLKRNLTIGYNTTTKNLNRIRGQVNILETYSKQLLLQGKVNCTFDELTIDTSRNRYIVKALYNISKVVSSKSIKTRCIGLHRRLIELGVKSNSERSYSVNQERFSRNDKADKEVLLASELALNLELITENSDGKSLPEPDKQEHWVRALFEKAVYGFYKLNLNAEWNVKSGKILNWQQENPTPAIEYLMPSMKIDILLENKIKKERIVIDTKYASITAKGRFGGERFKSNYIYQLYTYLRSQEVNSDQLSLNSIGMLLHPSVGVSYNENVMIQGHKLRFCTIDLTLSPNEISEKLMNLIN